MDWKYFEPKFEYEEMLNDFSFPWSGHKYFAYDLIRNFKPKRIVELGTYRGTSLFSFCQSIKDEKIDCEIFAIDTWEGDEHSGFYGSEVLEEVKKIKNAYYSKMNVKFFQKKFDDAIVDFEDKSINILHIDGLHTYEAVKHDFESWLPKVNNDGIILFHDIMVNRDDFGVYKLWAELKKIYSTMEFHYSYGLGILFKNNNMALDMKDELEMHYSYSLEDRENRKIGIILQDLNKKELEIEQSKQLIYSKEQEIKTKEEEIEFMKASKFWKLRNYFIKIKKW